METIQLKKWEELEEKINEDNENFEKVKNKLKEKNQYGSVFELLFRAEDTDKNLITSLDKFCKENKLRKVWSVRNYHSFLEHILPIVESDTSKTFGLPEFEYYPPPNTPTVPPGIEFMTYLRHHGFPSPLLDWTQNLYIAAFFAFHNPKRSKGVAIYSFREFCGNFKVPPSPNSYGPQILTVGHYIETDQRHNKQKTEYSYCRRKSDQEDEWVYCPHEDVDQISGQDNLKKYILPISEREKVLEKLNSMNINTNNLFGDKGDYMDDFLKEKLNTELVNFLKEM